MSIGNALTSVMRDYCAASAEPLTDHALAILLRRILPQQITSVLGASSKGLKVQGSPGQGQWATVPWVSIFDLAVTDTAMREYYVVYLFHANGGLVHLSLNQGATATRREFGARAPAVLAERASFIRQRIQEFCTDLPVTSIKLGSDRQLPVDYEAGHALGVSYSLTNLPSDEVLQRDLLNIARAYRTLTFRGGLSATPELEMTDAPQGGKLVEARRYAFHRRIERRPHAAALAKKVHGCRCQACGLSFEERYGPLGLGFIEAHHVRPLSSLVEGEPVDYDIATDFAVLCANCHRMIHRAAAGISVSDFRALISRK